ncbi:MAG TPA: cupin domain-containing protein [Edaphobacter sp.]|jgi:mannose-6-phosphate isomerase-like protein (cupin superfamily)|nr:cupin domain-containing protein [Edaphobacter sp.]
MVKDQSRRNFFLTAPLAAVSLSLADKSLFASPISSAEAQTADAGPHDPFTLFSAGSLEEIVKGLQAAPGNKQLAGSKITPFTIVVTVETNKSAKEFEYHEHRDHVFQILEGTTQYELGGTPKNPHSTGPGEWLAPASEGSRSVTLRKGDMLVIPRGTPHKRSTPDSVTLTLISIQDVPRA